MIFVLIVESLIYNMSLRIFHYHFQELIIDHCLCSSLQYGFARLNVIFTIVGLILSLISLAFWLHVFYVYEIDIFHLFWLPFGNMSCLLLAMYVDNDMNSLLKDADLLETFQYDVKSV